jgi:hypothetical protein
MQTELSSDLTRKAQWVADMMRADGVKPEQVTESLAMAYMAAISRKIQALQNTYLTRNCAREAMQGAVLAELMPCK